MAFKKKVWKDRLVEFSGRRLLKRISGSADSQMVVDVTRNEGTVSQAGDAFSAANMNDFEQRIADAFTEMTKSFQAGVDTLFNKCKSCGSTPSAKTPTAISTSIQSIYNNRYNAGVAANKISKVTISANMSEYKYADQAGAKVTGTITANISDKSVSSTSGTLTLHCLYNATGAAQDFTIPVSINVS